MNKKYCDVVLNYQEKLRGQMTTSFLRRANYARMSTILSFLFASVGNAARIL